MDNGYRFLLTTTLLLMIFLSELHAQAGTVETSFPGPYRRPTGLAFDGSNLWVADLSSLMIYSIDPSSGRVLSSFAAPGSSPCGLAWDGKHLWCSDNTNDCLYRLDPTTGTVLQRLSIPSNTPRGLEVIGGRLYYQDSEARLIYVLDPASGAVLSWLTSPSGANRGLAWDGSYLWSADRSANELYQVDTLRKKVVTILSAPGTYTYGLAWDGTHLWSADYEQNRISRINVRGDELLVRFAPEEVSVLYEVETRNEGSSDMRLTTYLAVPYVSPFQELLSEVNFTPPGPIMLSDQYGQQVATYSDTLTPGQIGRYSWQVNARLWSVRYLYLHERVGHLAEIPEDVRTLYTQDGSKYDIRHPVIQAAVAEALQGETNVYWMVRDIHDYVIAHIYYNRDGRWDDAPQVLAQGHGSCSEYSMVFIAMCRAAGIPACYEAGGHIRDSLPYVDTVWHRWTYVYLPRVGWVPVDCTWDDKTYPADQARYFGGYSNMVFATTRGGGSSSFLSWDYNVRQTSSGGSRATSRRMVFSPVATLVDACAEPPQEYSLQLRLYPNPFNQQCRLVVNSVGCSPASIRVLNALGREVARLWEGTLLPGENLFSWYGQDDHHLPLPSGVYFVQVRTEEGFASRQLSLIR